MSPSNTHTSGTGTIHSLIDELFAKRAAEVDRRRHERIPWSTAAILQLPVDTAGQPGHRLQVVTVDVSHSGFGCISSESIADGTRILAQFPNASRKPEVTGLVRYCETVTAGVCPNYRIGIEFDEATDGVGP